MAVLARLVVPIGGNSSGLARELAKSYRLAETWSNAIGANSTAYAAAVVERVGMPLPVVLH